jgi:hypothetical protein
MGIEHLSDEEWAELLLPRDSGSQHLVDCAHCRGQRDQLQKLLGTLPQGARFATEHDDIFWERQRLAIQSRIKTLPAATTSATRLVWATALVLVLIATFLLNTGSRIAVQPSVTESDRELLVQVEQVLNGDVPQALQPASLIANEIDQATQPHTNARISKESQHED